MSRAKTFYVVTLDATINGTPLSLEVLQEIEPTVGDLQEGLTLCFDGTVTAVQEVCYAQPEVPFDPTCDC